MKTFKRLTERNRSKHYKFYMLFSLICLLIMGSMVCVACNNKSEDGVSENDKTEDTRTQPTDSPAVEPAKEIPAGTQEPTSSEAAKPIEEPSPVKQNKKDTDKNSDSSFIPSEEVMHSNTAFTQGGYLFYKSGKLSKTVIEAMNLKTGKVTELATTRSTTLNSGEFYLSGKYIYYNADGSIYRVGVDGKNNTRLYKGKATILGVHKKDILALDRKARELIRINEEGQKKTLTKLNSIDTLEAVMVQDGIYYISKSSNNTMDGNDPSDRLYYVSLDGKNKTVVDTALDIYDLKSYRNDIFYLSISDDAQIMMVNMVKNHDVSLVDSLSKDELQGLGCNWFEANTFTLLAANATHVYYGIDFNNGKAMNIYSTGMDGEGRTLFLNAFDIEGINQAAYFMRGEIDGDYLKVVFDCDEAPVESYLIDRNDKSTIKFAGDYYLPSSIDVEGKYVYYCKTNQADRYGEMPDTYQYGRIIISELK